jgi:hypothetical protein
MYLQSRAQLLARNRLRSPRCSAWPRAARSELGALLDDHCGRGLGGIEGIERPELPGAR